MYMITTAYVYPSNLRGILLDSGDDSACSLSSRLVVIEALHVIQWSLSIVDTMGPSWLSCMERCPYFRSRFAHSSMWLGQQTVSSLER